MKPRSYSTLSGLWAAIALCAACPNLHAAPVSMTGTSSYTQNFDTLPVSGTAPAWANDSTLAGWYASSVGTISGGLTLTPDAGSNTSGNLKSYGSASATDRALGSICSNTSGALAYGVVLQNNALTDIEVNSIAYKGEQWRNGGNATAQKLAFTYFLSSTAPTGTTGSTEFPVSALDFTSPIATTTAAPLDGNATANSKSLSATTSIIVPAGQFLFLKWTDVNDSGNDHGMGIDDLTVSWHPNVTGDTTPPTVSSFAPANGATNVPKDLYSSSNPLILTFSENVQIGTGTISIKNAATNSIVESFSVDSAHIAAVDNTVYIYPSESTTFSYGTQYYIEVPSGAFTDTATTPNAFAGLSGTGGWSFTTAAAPTQPTVVINKYMNGSPDTVELLVVGDTVPGHTVNLQGMILKDFTSSMAGDNGGSFTFSTDTLWSAVPVGTLITLSNSTTTSDIVASDYTLNVGLLDTTYFSAAGSFDISTTEMVMIKASGSGTTGTTGGIHALAGGVAGSLYTSYTGAKLIAGSGGSGGSGVIALNSTSTIADFMTGTDAQGAVALTASSFGVPNNGTNAAFIKTLRGQSLADGDGSAYVLNATSSSVFNGRSFFDKGQTGQSAKVVLTATISSVTLTKAKITIPAALGTPTSVSLSGTGSYTISGQDINITGAAITTTSPLEVTIGGLSTPTPSLATDNGNYTLTVQTTDNSGTLTAIASAPAARVVIPISSLRDVTTAGVPLDLGTVVAVEGVCTEENFGTTNLQAFIQDNTAGVNVFSSNLALATLVRGNKYAVYGTVQQFNGLTELTPSSADGIIDLGAVGEATPEVVSITTLLASPEAYEGKLVTVKSLSKTSTETDTWSSLATITCQDTAAATLNIFIAGGSTATTEPSSYPVDITGIFSQSDTTSPYTASYSLNPRDMSDLVASVTTGNFASWATTNGISGASADGDADGDGIANILEYALGLSPTTANSAPGTFTSGTLSFTKGTDALANGDLTYVIETSTDLSSWTPVVTQAAGNTSTSISYTLPTGQSKIFARLKVTN